MSKIKTAVKITEKQLVRVWLGFSATLSRISTVMLTCLVFAVVVIPVGLCRRLFGHDELKIRQFKKDGTSVMVDRNHTYTKEDLLHTF